MLGKWSSSLINFFPELAIKADFIKFSVLFKRGGSISRYSTFKFFLSSLCTREEPRTDKPVYFTPESEYEVIRDTVSHKLDGLIVNPYKKFEETQLKLKLQLHPSRLVTL